MSPRSDRPRPDAAGHYSLKAATGRARRLVPASGTVDDLVAAVGRERSRTIRLHATEMGPRSPTGAWIETEATDWIVYPVDASPAERDVIVCHELAHMLLEHHPDDTVEIQRQLVCLVAPDISPEVALRFLNRHGYLDAAEAEAEQLATMLVTFMTLNAANHALRRDAVSDRLR